MEQKTALTLRRERVASRLTAQLKSGTKTVGTEQVSLTIGDITRIKKELGLVNSYLSGKKRVRRVKKGQAMVSADNKDRWFLDIFKLHYGYTKRSERRKNKGKSRKKMKKVKTVTFVKSVILQPGMMAAYRDGKMGISPREHSFRARKEEIMSF